MQKTLTIKKGLKCLHQSAGLVVFPTLFILKHYNEKAV